MAVMAVIAVVGLVVSVASTGVGIGQKSKAMRLQQDAAAQQRVQNVLITQGQNWDKQVIGARGDATSVINAVITSKIDAEATVKAAAASKQGDVLLVIGAVTGVLSLGILVFSRKKKE